VKDFVLPYLHEISLLPVLFALLGHVMIVVALVMVNAVRDQFLPAWGALFVLGAVSFGLMRFEFRVRRRPGAIAWAVLGTWIVSGIVAVIAGTTGVL